MKNHSVIDTRPGEMGFGCHGCDKRFATRQMGTEHNTTARYPLPVAGSIHALTGTFVIMTDEPTADETPPPDPNELVNRVRALLDMGITDVDQMKALILDMSIEEARTKLSIHVDRIVGRFQTLQRDVKQLTDELIRLYDATMQLASSHREAQDAILKRIAALSAEASAEELFALVGTYVTLPPPYSQEFYRPQAENYPPHEDEPESGTTISDLA
jgi:hypothetical protein